MLASALLIPSLLAPTVLYRGAELPEPDLRYWSVEDATLDSSQAEANLGGLAYLNGGPGKTILIRFGDLRRALGSNRRIVSAKLELTSTGPDSPRLSSASNVLVDWNEGPAFVVSFRSPRNGATAAPLAATYRYRRAGKDPSLWQGIGCSGLGDAATLTGAAGASKEQGVFEVSGIEAAIQRTYDSPFDNGGIALRFETNCEFFSSQAPEGRPRLIVTTEPAATTGRDASVTLISRSPWPQPTPAVSGPTVEQDGRRFELPPGSPPGPWPADGELITYTATVKNVGKEAIDEFSCRWASRETWGSWTDFRRKLSPGESTTVTFQKPFKLDASDHRSTSIRCEVRAASDQNGANNGLEVPEVGFDVTALLAPQSAYEGVSYRGSSAREDFAQSMIQLANRVVLPNSRASFAPDGPRARFFIQSFKDGEELWNTDGSAPTAATLGAFVPRGGAARSIEFLLRSIGIVPVPPSQKSAFIVRGGAALEVRPTQSLAPGIVGGGETRYDGGIPNFLMLLPEPVSNPLLDNIVMEASGLLSLTDVYAIEARLQVRSRNLSTHLFDQPALILFSAQAMDGRPLKGAKIRAYPMSGDASVPARHIAETTADDKGGFSLPDRKPAASHPKLKANCFGAIDPAHPELGLVIEAEFKGQTSFAYLAPWQLTDMRARSGLNPVVCDLRFNVTDGTVGVENLAKGRLVTDSSKSLPTALSPIVDEKLETGADLPVGDSAWIEIDMGRDRTIGEVSITVSGDPFWSDFDIAGYNTGQIASEAVSWRRVRDFDWSRRNASEAAGDLRTIRFRAAGQTYRYIRIRKFGKASAGKVREVRVYGVSAS